MILVTGGAGFIGSNLINYLSNNTSDQIVSVDNKNRENGKYFSGNLPIKITPEVLETFLNKNQKKVNLVIHLGAITSTTEKNVKLIIENNLNLSIFLWNWCVKKKKRFIYASSAATYGNKNSNFDDKDCVDYLSNLFPLNIYGWSKHIFDKFVLKKSVHKISPPQCVGLKFFNVYGPNEFHKGEMKSIILKIFQKINEGKKITLFKSHNPDFKDGEQLRDFVYVKDVIKVIMWFIKKPNLNGIFNVGSGEPRTFNDLANNVFLNCNYRKKIKYIDTPKEIRLQYQYFTKANISKLRKTGYKDKFLSLEDGVKDYIRNHLT